MARQDICYTPPPSNLRDRNTKHQRDTRCNSQVKMSDSAYILITKSYAASATVALSARGDIADAN